MLYIKGKLNMNFEKNLQIINKSLQLLLLCHRKHCLSDDSITWEQLTDQLNDAVSQLLGEKEYLKFIEKYGKDENVNITK